MTVAVVTVVAGRHEHLRVQRNHLAACGPALHVVVAVGDPGADRVLAASAVPTRAVHLDRHPAGLPIAAARNAGAAAAVAAGASTLVFLDVDCIPAADLLERYDAAVTARPDAVACGPVTYLPPAPPGGWNAAALAAARAPHPARPDPPPGETAVLAPKLFWSLSFALSAPLWRASGGFYEGYVGYGGEDTDFAASLAAAGTAIVMLGGADSFHQHHPVSHPPVEHLDDIVRNAGIYVRRHGELPMRGWLDSFAGSDRVVAGEVPPVRTDAVRVATVPARHEYLDAALPPTVRRVRPDRVRGWEPDPLLTDDGLATLRDELDVVHVHFGYDHVDEAALAVWLAELHRAGVPLVVTVHDLRNPHHPTRGRHDRQLRLLLGHAARALTLTAAAADECAGRFGRRPEVVPHPTLLSTPLPPPGSAVDAREVLLPLKALRGNVREPLALVGAAAAGAAATGGRLRVLVEPATLERPELAGLGDLAAVSLDVTPRLPHDDLVARVGRAHAVVLPYRFGTHSGWVELARDTGTAVVAPDCGHYGAQWDAVHLYGNNEAAGLDAASLHDAVAAALAAPRPDPAGRRAREAERDLVRATHDQLYREVSR